MEDSQLKKSAFTGMIWKLAERIGAQAVTLLISIILARLLTPGDYSIVGVVNVFSDIVSYIRLWAVGLAGGAISATVNDMAGPMLGGAIIFLGVLLLVFGHGLNMILNVLSVIVHGVRLNTLEFSSHLGMSWSGFAYEPFCEGADNK